MNLTIGLVGCGRWGGVHLRTLQNLKSTGHVRRVAVCDIDPDKLADIQADATYASFDQMLENEHLDGSGRPKIPPPHFDRPAGDIQLTLFGPAEHPLVEEIRELDLNHLTPIEALTRIQEWKDQVALKDAK